MTDRELHKTWFLSYVVFVQDIFDNQAGDEIRVQKQLHLFSADGPIEALRKTIELGEMIASVASYLRYLGVANMVVVGRDLGDGTLLDTWIEEYSWRDPPDPSSLGAFHPAGPGVPPERRRAYYQELWDSYRWYVADEILVPRSEAGSAEVQSAEIQMTLIWATNPNEAMIKATEDGNARASRLGKRFVGLRELSLVTDKLEDGCEISWSESYVPSTEIEKLVRPPETMKAFMTE